MTQEEQAQAAIEAFFADQNLTEKEQEIFWEMALNGSAIIDMNGNIVRGLDVSELKGKRIAIIGNHSAGLTEWTTPQTVTQVDAAQYAATIGRSEMWVNEKVQEVLTLNKRQEVLLPQKIELLIIHTPIYDTSSTKKRYNRRGKNNKYF